MPPLTQRRNCGYLNSLKEPAAALPGLELISGARSSGASDLMTWLAESVCGCDA